mgnify:CR=1 FL=1
MRFWFYLFEEPEPPVLEPEPEPSYMVRFWFYLFEEPEPAVLEPEPLVLEPWPCLGGSMVQRWTCAAGVYSYLFPTFFLQKV